MKRILLCTERKVLPSHRGLVTRPRTNLAEAPGTEAPKYLAAFITHNFSGTLTNENMLCNPPKEHK